jgi:hypothetical protein
MPTKKSSKTGKKPQLKVRDLKPSKDAKGGINKWKPTNEN